MFNLTPVVRNIIYITVAVFIIQMIWEPATYYLSLYDIKSGYFRPYQFFSYMFAHSPRSIFHIFFNLMALASLGPILESFWGDKKFLAFYLATGIGAGMIYAVAHLLMGTSGGSMVGASGAVYGVLTAIGLTFPDMQLRMFLFPPVKAKYLVFIIGIATYLLDTSGKVAHLAHLGGIIMAVIVVSIWGGGAGRR